MGTSVIYISSTSWLTGLCLGGISVTFTVCERSCHANTAHQCWRLQLHDGIGGAVCSFFADYILQGNEHSRPRVRSEGGLLRKSNGAHWCRATHTCAFFSANNWWNVPLLGGPHAAHDQISFGVKNWGRVFFSSYKGGTPTYLSRAKTHCIRGAD